MTRIENPGHNPDHNPDHNPGKKALQPTPFPEKREAGI